MQLSIIIVNYNVKYFLEQCLCSIQKATVTIEAETLVIDNASSDGSIEYLKPQFPAFTFVRNERNTGYAKANNQGLLLAQGKRILFLNPDVILPEDSLHKCIQFLDTHPEAGACGLRMLDGSGRFLPESKRGFPSLQTSFYKLFGMTKMFPHSARFARYYLGHLRENEDNEVDVLTGAFFMTRKEVLAKTGGFDEQFFMYGEDIDLSYRIQQSGYRIFYLSQASIIHFKGESTRKGSLNYVVLFYKAMSIFVRKHYGGRQSSIFTTFIQLSVWVRAMVSAIGIVYKRKTPRQSPDGLRTLIIGDDKEVQEVVAILDKNEHPSREVGYASPEAGPAAIMAHTPEEVIFCQGKLSYLRIIELMQQLPGNISFMIHSEGSNSIVGSDSKNTSGTVLV